MPPKKKGGKGKDDDPNKQVAVPKSFKISRQLDQEKIDFLTKRINEILSSNNELRTSSSRNEKDTHDIVLYFQREMEMKDDIISRLNEELVKRETQLKFEVERMKKKFEDSLGAMRDSSDQTIQELKDELATALADLSAIAHYQEEKNEYEHKLATVQRSLEDQRQEMFESLDEQERKFLDEKAAIWRDVDNEKVAFREVALREARDLMGEEARKIVADNTRMREELKFHTVNSAELTAERATLQAELVKSRRDVAILSDKEIEYARQGYLKTKEIKALRERVEHLEKMQTSNMEKFKHKTKEIESNVSRELELATLDAAGLRRLLKLKNKELLHMKTLAATILSQRTETEQFFLESLAEVKDLVRKEKQRTAVETKIVLNKLRAGAGSGSGSGSGGGKRAVAFPPLNVKGANLHHLDARDASQLPVGAASSGRGLADVHIRDLSWDDKELVLRVLFAKMNGQEKQQGGGSGGLPKVPGRGGASMPMPMPVFISEGGGEGQADYEAAVQFQLDNFQMPSYSGEGEGEGDGDDGALYDDPEDM